MMVFGWGASTCAPTSRRSVVSRNTGVTVTAVPAVTTPALPQQAGMEQL
jgi:hypothetical protein